MGSFYLFYIENYSKTRGNKACQGELRRANATKLNYNLMAVTDMCFVFFAVSRAT